MEILFVVLFVGLLLFIGKSEAQGVVADVKREPEESETHWGQARFGILLLLILIILALGGAFTTGLSVDKLEQNTQSIVDPWWSETQDHAQQWWDSRPGAGGQP